MKIKQIVQTSNMRSQSAQSSYDALARHPNQVVMRAKAHQEQKQPTITLISEKIAPDADEQLNRIAKRRSS